MRGIASLMVFFTHIINGYVIHVDSGIGGAWSKVLSNIGVFGVEIFFFLSGFVIYKASLRSSVKSFFMHRFWRIYPLFLLFTLFYFISNELFVIDENKLGYVNLISNLLFLDLFLSTKSLTPNAWSLTFEVWYYIVTFFIVSYLNSKKHYVLFLFSLAISIYLLLFYPISMYFALGVALSICDKRVKSKVLSINLYLLNFVQLSLLIFLVFFVSTGNKFSWVLTFDNLYGLFIPVLLFSFMVTLLSSKTLISRFLSLKQFVFFGNISFALYLLHPYSYLISRNIISKYLVGATSNVMVFLFYLVLTSVLTLILTMIISKYFENVVYNKMTNKNIYLGVRK
ncbi:hypothetical protein PE36_06282 [Moritella sp. PE36]|nr:acyltransferase [Moritella sp. PE36]EDM69071.1 hypothetical protein PE36_06282 [Moritella sp. PE36]